jgi:DNA-directed RNA polymerase subunit RPC12/RpoP
MAAEVIICPDCGGIIGAKETTDEGKPCTCFKDSNYKKDEPAGGEGDTSVFGQQVVAKPKVCNVCGKDLTGKKRLRDSRGYWCVDCHKADQAANKPQGVRCSDCGRIVAEGAITEYAGIRICGKCRSDREEVRKRERRFGKVDDAAYQNEDKRGLYILLGIFGVLVVIVILAHFHILH